MTILVGDKRRFTVTAFDEAGTEVPGPSFTVAWTSNDSSVATVDSEGLAIGVKPGTTSITVQALFRQSGAVSDQAALSVVRKP